MPTRSTKLAALTEAAGGVTDAFTVPPGYTYLVKEVLVVANGGAPTTVLVRGLDAGGIAGYLIHGKALAINENVEWDGWMALNPGDKLQVQSVGGLSSFWVSGTKLPGIA